MRRGEIWWVERPSAIRRPYLVLTRDAAIQGLESILGVPTTTPIPHAAKLRDEIKELRRELLALAAAV